MFKDARQYARDVLAECENDIAKSRILVICAARSFQSVPAAFFSDVFVLLESEHGK